MANSTAAFLLAICGAAGEPADVHDPLAAADVFLAAHGNTAEGRLLRRVIDAIAFGLGSFDEHEIWLLSRDTQRLVSALCDARLRARYAPLEWAALR